MSPFAQGVGQRPVPKLNSAMTSSRGRSRSTACCAPFSCYLPKRLFTFFSSAIAAEPGSRGFESR